MPSPKSIPPSQSSLPSMMPRPRPDVLIVGGGLIGLFCADVLAERGRRVEIWDRADSIPASGRGVASWASAGMLAPLAEVPDDLAFLRLCLEARDLWQEVAPALEDASGTPLDYDTSGALLFERPDGLVERFERAARQAGEESRRLDFAEASELVPELLPSAGPFLFLPGEHRVDNRRVCLALRRRLEERGVSFRLDESVLEVYEEKGGAGVQGVLDHADAGAVLITAGAWSSSIRGLPLLPVHPVKGQMMRFAGVDWPLEGCLRGGHLYAARRCGPLEDELPGEEGDELLLGATVEPEAGFDTEVTGEGLATLLEFARDVMPGLLQKPVVETWAGLRPGSVDGRPLIGPLGERLWLATGHYRNGVLLAPWTARFLADWLDAGEPPSAAAAELFEPLRGGSAEGPPQDSPGSATPRIAESTC